MAESFATLWAEVDAMRAKSAAECKATRRAVRELEGWRFVRCAEGMVWSARNTTTGEVIRGGSGKELIAALKAAGAEPKKRKKKTGPTRSKLELVK